MLFVMLGLLMHVLQGTQNNKPKSEFDTLK